MLGSRLKGHQVDACLIEQAATGEERYLGVMVDAASYGLRVIYSAQGGVDIEQSGSAQGRLCPPHPGAAAEALAELIAGEPDAWRGHIAAVGRKLADMLHRARTGAGRDQSAVRFRGRLRRRRCEAGGGSQRGRAPAAHRRADRGAAATYADANRKLTEGFDYVEIDPEGEIGLVTTGAGLSMMLIDELTARGMKPLNFCDIRTGQMRGSPARLMRVLEWITARPSLRAVLVSVFAGITDLAEFAELLATGMEQTPGLRVPVVARLVGRGAAEARRILAERQPDVLVTEDLEEALGRIDAWESWRRWQRRGGHMIGTLSRSTPVIVQGITGRMGRTHAALMRAYGTNIVGGTSHADRHEGSRRRAGVRQLPRRRAGNRRGRLGRDGAAAGNARRGRGGTRRRHQAHRHGGRRHAAARRDADRPRRPPCRRYLDRRLHARHGDPRRDQARLPAGCLPASRPARDHVEERHAVLRSRLSPGARGPRPEHLGRRRRRSGEGRALRRSAAGVLRRRRTHAIVLVGEVGGSEEEECADALARLGVRKPLYALIAGREAKEGVSMGHAGALVFGEAGTFASKTRRLTAAGARVFSSIEAMVEACVQDFAAMRS